MATHRLTFDLTTDQVIALNGALNEHYEANTGALDSRFPEEYSYLMQQCQALDVLINSIKKIVEPSDAK